MLNIYHWFMARIATLRAHNERGAAAVEYGLLVGLIGAAIVLTVSLLGNEINAAFCTVTNELPFISDTTTCS